MSFDPIVSTTPYKYLSNLSEEAASAWLAVVLGSSIMVLPLVL
jgi:hypothetical protein